MFREMKRSSLNRVVYEKRQVRISDRMKCVLWTVTLLSCLVGNNVVATTTNDDDNTHRCNENSVNMGQCQQTYQTLDKPTEFIESSTTGVKLALRRWVPETTTTSKSEITQRNSVAIFLHGGAGFHSGYFDVLGQYMKTNGIPLVSYDSVGQGYSDSTKGIRTYYDSIDTLINDFTIVLNNTRSYYKDYKVFVIGESFGGFVLLSHILQEQQKKVKDANVPSNYADGYIFSIPMVKVLHFFPMVSMPGTDVFSTWDLAFGDKLWSTTSKNDPFVIEAAKIAPKLGQVASILRTMDKINKSFTNISVPFKILIGQNELRVDVTAMQQLYNQSTSIDKEIEIVSGGYHQMFQDIPNVTQYVCHRIHEWILAKG